MAHQSKPKVATRLAFKADICTAFLVVSSLIMTLITMSAYHVLLMNFDSILILFPYLLVLGLLVAAIVLHASDRNHLALVTTTAILSIFTFITYIPALSRGPGCMNGMVFIFSTLFSIGFPIVYLVCWLLYGLRRQAEQDAPSNR
jgi:hypothetical protein